MADPPARAATGANGVIVAGDGDIVVYAAGPHPPDYGNQIEEACPGLAARAVHSCLDRLTAGDELVICWNRREESLRDDFRFWLSSALQSLASARPELRPDPTFGRVHPEIGC